MNREAEHIRLQLYSLADATYAAFQLKLMPGMAKERVTGVRMPMLRALARELRGTQAEQAFMLDLPHAYYDEDNLHALLINDIKGFDAACAAVEAFLPYVNNWATCDALRPKAFCGERERLLERIRGWIDSDHPYAVRFGLEMLMVHFLGQRFAPQALRWTAQVRSEHYYVKMMAAWLFATALASDYDEALAYIRENRLDAWTHNKAIQKARESDRVTKEHKEELRAFRR